MSLGGGSSSGGGSYTPPPAPAPTVIEPGVDKARLDLLQRMRRAKSREKSRVTLNAQQNVLGPIKPPATLPSFSGSSKDITSGTGGGINMGGMLARF